MKRTTRTPKQLRLSRHTVRRLTVDSLDRVHGGLWDSKVCPVAQYDSFNYTSGCANQSNHCGTTN